MLRFSSSSSSLYELLPECDISTGQESPNSSRFQRVAVRFRCCLRFSSYSCEGWNTCSSRTLSIHVQFEKTRKQRSCLWRNASSFKMDIDCSTLYRSIKSSFSWKEPSHLLRNISSRRKRHNKGMVLAVINVSLYCATVHRPTVQRGAIFIISGLAMLWMAMTLLYVNWMKHQAPLFQIWQLQGMPLDDSIGSLCWAGVVLPLVHSMQRSSRWVLA